MSKNNKVDMDEGLPALTMGWFQSQRSPFLQLINMTFFGQTPCAEMYKHQLGLALDDSNVCAIGKLPSDACATIHGSPLVRMEDGKEVLVGLLNFSWGCNRSDMPSVFSRVKNEPYYWVGRYTNLDWPYSTH